MAKFIPSNIDDFIWSAYIANYQCPEVIEPEISEDIENQESQIEESDSELITILNTLYDNQGTIYNDMISSFAQLQQMVSDLAVTCSAQADVVSAEPIIDEKEQQRLELQAQIEALQAQMASL